MGYRREYQVEARGEVAVRGAIVDVYPLDRRPSRCASTCGATRSTGSRSSRSPTSVRPSRSPRSEFFRCASCSRPPRCGPGPPSSSHRAVGSRAVGAAGRGPDVRRDGVVAAVAVRRRAPAPADLLAAGASSRWSSPAALRDRAEELLDEEAALAGALAVTWGLDAERRRRDAAAACRCRSSGCSCTRRRRPAPVLQRARQPDTPDVSTASAFDPVVGDTDALAAGSRAAPTASAVRSPARAAARRRRDRAAARRRGRHRRPGGRAIDRRRRGAVRPGVHVVVAPLDRGVVVPGIQLAIVAEADSPAAAACTAGPGAAAAPTTSTVSPGRLRRAPRARRRPVPRHGTTARCSA